MEEDSREGSTASRDSTSMQILASCDESGQVVINESVSFVLEEGPVEVAYINIDEDNVLGELEGLEIIQNEDESSRQSFENGEVEFEFMVQSEEAYAEPAEEEQDLNQKIEVTNNYLEGKLSFQQFLAMVENSNEDKSESEGESDQGVSDEEDLHSKDDPDYVPEGFKPKILKSTKKLIESDSDADEEEEEPDHRKTKAQPESHPRGRRKGQKIVRRLPPALQGLMGEANLRFARGEKEDAIKLCMEVVRQAPTFPEPFRTLSMIYEDQGDFEKSHQLALIAAHLSPQDADEWLRLAEVCLGQDDSEQAAKCLAKAAHADPSNLYIHQKRCELLTTIGAHKDLLRACLTMLRWAQPENGEEWVELATNIARIHHAHGHLHSARRALSNALHRCSDNFNMEHFNLLMELQIITKKYLDVVKVLNSYCGLVFDYDVNDEEDLEGVKTLQLTQEIPLDIQSKLCVALIHLKRADLITLLVDTLLEADVEEYGDIYLDVAEAYMESQDFRKAAILLEKLVNSDKYSLAAVWLRYADCLVAMDQMEEAIVAFHRVIELAPFHQEARIRLSELLSKLGRPEEALEAVTQDWDLELIEATVLHKRCLLLLKDEHWDKFIQAFKLLISRHAKNIRSRDEVYKACGAKRIGWDSEEESADDEPEFGSSSIKPEEEYRLLRLAADYLLRQNRLVELERLCFTALTSPLFRKKPDIHRECRFLTLQVCMAKGDSYYAYNLARSLLLSNLNNSRVWNLFIQVIMRGDDIRHNRFLMRLMMKHPDNVCISVLNGHVCLAAGTYKYSLNEYMNACKQEPDNPFLALLNAIVLVQMTCQKFSSGKHSLVTQATAFFDSYLRLRGECQETYYNLGRAMHQLGILPAAIHYYEKALACRSSVTKGPNDHIFDLSREIAFNLSLVYRASGSLDLARMYLYKYISV